MSQIAQDVFLIFFLTRHTTKLRTRKTSSILYVHYTLVNIHTFMTQRYLRNSVLTQ